MARPRFSTLRGTALALLQGCGNNPRRHRSLVVKLRLRALDETGRVVGSRRMINWFEWRKSETEIGGATIDWRATDSSALAAEFALAAAHWRGAR